MGRGRFACSPEFGKGISVWMVGNQKLQENGALTNSSKVAMCLRILLTEECINPSAFCESNGAVYHWQSRARATQDYEADWKRRLGADDNTQRSKPELNEVSMTADHAKAIAD